MLDMSEWDTTVLTYGVGESHGPPTRGLWRLEGDVTRDAFGPSHIDRSPCQTRLVR